jgi:hypothetical protein
LTLLLGLIYFGAIVLSQAALRALTGGESPLAVVASTLAIAALFNPLRRHVQDFYRPPLLPEKVRRGEDAGSLLG